MRFILFVLFFAAASLQVSAQGAADWIEGRWSHGNGCTNWVQFSRNGSAWSYTEQRVDNGRPQPVTVTASANRVTAFITNRDTVYSYEATFQNRDVFQSVERFVKGGPPNNGPLTFTYRRC
jgi:hypothetical protein